MNLYELQSIKDINLRNLESKELRKIRLAMSRYFDGESSKRYIVRKGDRVHVCEDISGFLYYKYRDEPIYSFEFYEITQ